MTYGRPRKPAYAPASSAASTSRAALRYGCSNPSSNASYTVRNIRRAASASAAPAGTLRQHDRDAQLFQRGSLLPRQVQRLLKRRRQPPRDGPWPQNLPVQPVQPRRRLLLAAPLRLGQRLPDTGERMLKITQIQVRLGDPAEHERPELSALHSVRGRPPPSA